ncbi:unnamed protein product [Cochlearia groenlandica]
MDTFELQNVNLDFGIPSMCFCDKPMTLKTQLESFYFGREYYTCISLKRGKEHLWKWWKVAIMEKLKKLRLHSNFNEASIKHARESILTNQAQTEVGIERLKEVIGSQNKLIIAICVSVFAIVCFMFTPK